MYLPDTDYPGVTFKVWQQGDIIVYAIDDVLLIYAPI